MSWRILLFLTVSLLLTYVPVLTTPYAFMDDYALLFSRGQADSWERVQENAQMIAGGRPVLAFLVDVAYRSLGGIEDLRYLRLVGVLGLGLLAWSFFRTCILAGWDYYPSLFLTVLIFSLPPFQVYASWASTAFVPFAALIAGSASVLTEQSFAERQCWRKGVYAIAAVLSLLAAFAIYQPAAMFFCVFAAVQLFKPGVSLSSLARSLSWWGFVLGLGLLAGFALGKLGTTLYGEELLVPSRTALTLDPWGKIVWFVREPLACALNLMNLFPKRWSSILMLILISGGMALYFQGTASERLTKVVIAFLLSPISYLPNLVVAETWAAYRTQVALTSLIAVYAFFALQGYLRTLRGNGFVSSLTFVLGGVALLSVICAAHNVSAYFARPQLLELTWLRTRISHGNLASISSIYVVRPQPEHTLAPTSRYDEFGFPSLAAAWTPKPAVSLLVQEMAPERINLPIEAVSPEEMINPPPNALVIDMREMARSRGTGSSYDD